jgi:hypothetical protein
MIDSTGLVVLFKINEFLAEFPDADCVEIATACVLSSEDFSLIWLVFEQLEWAAAQYDLSGRPVYQITQKGRQVLSSTFQF